MPIPARVMFVPLDGSAPARWAFAEDVGRLGIFICTSAPLALGTAVILRMTTAYNQRYPIYVRGEVVHRVNGAGFGCRYVELEEGTQLLLDRLVQIAEQLAEQARAC